jgi:uncharacterized protein
MGKTLDALLKLQTVELQLVEVRRRLKARGAAVQAQQARIVQLKAEAEAVQTEIQSRQKQSGGVELDLKSREADISKLRQALNTSKSNKEYAAILTQINTYKADNSKLEDEALKLMQAVDQVQGRLREMKAQIEQAEGYHKELEQNSSAEVARLSAMVKDLEGQREVAAVDVPQDALALFNRLSANRDGDVMARIEVIGKKPPHDYVCGGCNMTIRAEHANALRTRNDIRFCDCCGRILYLDDKSNP